MADKKGMPYPRKDKTDWKNKTPAQKVAFEKKKRIRRALETGGMDFPTDIKPTDKRKYRKVKTGLGTSTTIKRMTGGVGHKTTKGTSVQDIERMRKDWEEAPMEGTPGPYNPQKMRLKKKKKKDASVTIKKLPPSRKQAMSAAERKKLIGMGVHPGDIEYTLETRKYRKKPKTGAGMDVPDTPVPRKSKKSGGTVKKQTGGIASRAKKSPATGAGMDFPTKINKSGKGIKARNKLYTGARKSRTAKSSPSWYFSPSLKEQLGWDEPAFRDWREKYFTPASETKATIRKGKQREKDRAAKQTPATQAKKGGALGTGAALRGFGRGYKKGGTI